MKTYYKRSKRNLAKTLKTRKNKNEKLISKYLGILSCIQPIKLIIYICVKPFKKETYYSIYT
jgi:hypothetical protein